MLVDLVNLRVRTRDGVSLLDGTYNLIPVSLNRSSLHDTDGENRAVRAFLQLYGTTSAVTIERMFYHLEESGWAHVCPPWAAKGRGHLTTGGAQSWICHMLAQT